MGEPIRRAEDVLRYRRVSADLKLLAVKRCEA